MNEKTSPKDENRDKLVPDAKKVFIKERYDSESYARHYDNRYRTSQFEKIEYFSEEFNFNSDLLLDLGAGTGLLWEFLRTKTNKRLPETNKNDTIFIAVDISFGMLKIFADKLQQPEKSNIRLTPLIQNTHLVCCDGEYLPFREKSFKSTFALTSLQNIPDLKGVLKEIKRVSQLFSQAFISYLKKSISPEKLDDILQQTLGNAVKMNPDPKKHRTHRKLNHNPLEDWLYYIKIHKNSK
jgi:SAM-dependent methyltransferase